MVRARRRLAERNLYLLDTPYDGSCIVWSTMRALGAALERVPSEDEARELLVDTMARPELRRDLAQDLVQTNAERRAAGERELASVDELLAEYRRPKAYLHPILAAQALELLTGGSIEVLTTDTSDAIVRLYASDADEPFSARLYFEPTISHMAHLMPLPGAVVQRIAL